VRYLLDTHAVLWLRAGDARLSRRRWEPRLLGGDHEILVSMASLWEMSIKRTLGRLSFDGSMPEFARGLVEIQGFRLLPIEATHLHRLEALPVHHRDPFDRLLIAQALELGATCVTRDEHWAAYGVTVDW